ncbi:hypothetical protein FACS1894158_16880 [Betaproteobacteria bacterium]|nr:hypothetical protein FACS1894158_16880 [Betaproteobacteria bacterium]
MSYSTAWLIHHKLMQAMAHREERYVSENKIPFVAAISLSDEGHPLRIKLTPVSGFSLKAIAQWAQSCLASDSIVFSDGLACFTAVTAAGCTHHPTVVAGRKPKDLPEFKWINTGSYHLSTSENTQLNISPRSPIDSTADSISARCTND